MQREEKNSKEEVLFIALEAIDINQYSNDSGREILPWKIPSSTDYINKDKKKRYLLRNKERRKSLCVFSIISPPPFLGATCALAAVLHSTWNLIFYLKIYKLEKKKYCGPSGGRYWPKFILFFCFLGYLVLYGSLSATDDSCIYLLAPEAHFSCNLSCSFNNVSQYYVASF